MRRHPSSYLILASTLSLGLLWSCAGILGIDEAECDPGFDSSCSPLSNAPGMGGDSGNPTGGNGGAAASSGGAGAAGPIATAGVAGSVDPGLAGSSGASGESNSAGTLCAEYCTTLAANCTGTNLQYASETACLAVCAALAPGTDGDMAGNTVQCRLGRAELAASTGEPSDYCFSAGPGGAGVCGSDCEGFCAVMSATCTELGSPAQCLESCSAIPDLSLPPQNARYNATLQSGDSLQCRLFHVSAASLDPVGHCPHAAGMAPCSAPL